VEAYETCDHAKKESCQGGCCKGFAEAKCEELGISVSEPSEKELLNLKPVLSDKVTIRKYDLPVETSTINFHDGFEMEIQVSVAELTVFFDLKTTMIHAMKTKLLGITQSNEDEVLGDLLIEISSQEILPIARRLLEKKVLLIKEALPD
jgi:hypothetical protein